MKNIFFTFSLLLLQVSTIAQTNFDTTNNMMNKKNFLSQKVAKKIAELAEQEAQKMNLTVSISIVNEFGQLIYFTKMDESTNASADISIAKAKHSAYYRRDTKFHQDLLSKGNNVVLALPNSMPIEGGVQLIYKGKTIGAIGVSGASSEDDGKIAKIAADFLNTLK
jgi:glc operon protein GlcG